MTSRYRWVVLAVGAAGAGAFATLQMGLAALGPAMRDAYHLSLPEVGLAFTAIATGVVLTLVPWGVLSDRIGERPVMAAGLGGTAAALVVSAYAPGYGGLLAGLFAAGMLGASATGASGRAVMGWFDRSQRGFALGIRQMALPLGGALGSLSLPHVADVGGMRGALLALSGLILTAAVAALSFMRDPPGAPRAPSMMSAPPPMRDRRLWRLGAAGALLVAAQSSMLSFVVLFLHDVRGASVGAAAAGLGVFQLLGAAGRIVAGRRSDREGRRIAPMRRIALRNAALLALTGVLSSGPSLLLYPALMCAIVSGMSWNGLAFTAAAEISGAARAGTAMSLENTIIALGGGVGPSIFGVVVDATTWQSAFVVIALTPLAGAWVLRSLEAEEERRVGAREGVCTELQPSEAA